MKSARGCAGGDREEAERDHRHQPHPEQQRDPTGFDHALEPVEARPAQEPVEERPRRVVADPVGDDAVREPARHHQRQADPEPVDVAGRRVEDLGRIPDDDVDERQREDDQRAAEAEVEQVLAEPARVARDRGPDARPQRLDRQYEDRQDRDPGERDRDPRQRRADVGARGGLGCNLLRLGCDIPGLERWPGSGGHASSMAGGLRVGSARREPLPDAASSQYWAPRGVAQPGSAHRSGR